MKPRLLLVFLAAALLGCPDETTKTDKTAPPPAKTTPAKTADDDPLEGSLFSKDELLAIYAAEMKRDSDPAFRREVLTRHRLLDSNGKVNHARTEAYDRALKRYAEKAPEAWSKFVESLGEAEAGKTSAKTGK